MIQWINTEGDSWEGLFKSQILRDDEGGDELSVYIEHYSIKDYAEKCIEAVNSLSEGTLRKLCKGFVKAAKECGDAPEINDPLEILDYCWFTAVYINVPKNPKHLEYIVEGEGDWGDVIGFRMKDDKPVYIGVDYLT